VRRGIHHVRHGREEYVRNAQRTAAQELERHWLIPADNAYELMAALAQISAEEVSVDGRGRLVHYCQVIAAALRATNFFGFHFRILTCRQLPVSSVWH
jgi:hypothetical protein